MARIGFGLDSYVFLSGKYHILLPTFPCVPDFNYRGSSRDRVVPSPEFRTTKLCWDVVPVGGGHHGPIEKECNVQQSPKSISATDDGVPFPSRITECTRDVICEGCKGFIARRLLVFEGNW
jgi:hypothetical protein